MSTKVLKFTAVLILFGFFSFTSIACAFPGDTNGDTADRNSKRFTAKRDGYGRAYRIDENGFQITDHVAELEVTVDELRRQVQVLDEQLRAKNNTKSQKEKEYSPKPVLPVSPIREVSADVESNNRASDALSGEKNCSVQNARIITALKNQNTQLIDKVSNLEAIVKSKQSSNEQATSLIKELQEQRDVVQAELVRLMQEIETIKDENEEVIRAKLEENARVHKELEKTKQDWQAKISENSFLQAKLQNSSLRNGKDADEHYRARFDSDIATKDDLDSISQNDIASLLESKQEISKNIKTIDSLIRQRKDLVDNLRNSGIGVSVPVSTLRSESGLSLDTLRLAASKVSDDREAVNIGLGLAQVQKILQEDISVMKRLSRM